MPDKNVAKVVHLIPYEGIGGVERAAATMRNISSEDIDFRVETIFPPSAAKSRWVIWNVWHFLRSAMSLWRTRPTVLIVSLWRAYSVGIVVKLLRPKIRLVAFLHFPHDVHGLDFFLTRFAALLACEVWADSRETLLKRLSTMPGSKGRVISFVTECITPVVDQRPVRPVFIFWGRIHPQKSLQRAVRLFASIFTFKPEARFVVIGPDGGDLATVKHLVSDLGLSRAVTFLGAMSFSTIRSESASASFYLQTSDLEGMAMSVVEAMQLGLVPVVTPVGEIAHYCLDGYNSVVVQDDLMAAAEVFAMLNNNALFQRVRANAMDTWYNKPLYKDSVIAACRDIL